MTLPPWRLLGQLIVTTRSGSDYADVGNDLRTFWAQFTFLSAVNFTIGFVLMSLEMLATRYVFPYFGGGINTWAMLLCVVLTSLMIGCLFGGFLADRYPS